MKQLLPCPDYLGVNLINQSITIINISYDLLKHDTLPISTGNRGLAWRRVGEWRSGRSEVTLCLLHTGLWKTLREL